VTDILGYLAALLTTLAFVPQAILTLRTRNTRDLSLGMYGLFTLGLACWLSYGLLKKDLPIILANIITLILASSILLTKLTNTLSGKERS
jgi:MtN3 and saliva related transmembrane protein